MKLKNLEIWLSCLAIYVLMIVRWGYEFGRNDQMQVLGYALMLKNPDSFPLDNYLQTMHEKVPNERFLFSWLMSWTTPFLEVFCLIAHVVVTVLTLYLLYRIAKRFIKTDYLVYLALLFAMIVLYGFNLGSNEIYYNTFFVSNLVQLTGVFGIWLFLNEKFVWSMLIVGLAAILQPVIGVQLFVTLSGIVFIRLLLRKSNHNWSAWIAGTSVFLVTGGLWVIFLKLFFEENSVLSNSDFFDILFIFRAPHHYLPSAFPLLNYLIVGPILLFGTYYFFQKEERLGWFFAISFFGMLCYFVLVEGVRSVDAGALQWFKMTIWMKVFAVFALFAFVEEKLKWLKSSILIKLAFPVLLFTAILTGSVLVAKPGLIPWTVPYDYGHQYQTDAEVDVAVQAGKLTNDDAYFAHPIGFTTLKVYAQRSSFVEFKIMVHRKNAMAEWYRRLNLLYGISIESGLGGFEHYAPADIYFQQLQADQFLDLKAKYEITHVITFASHQLPFPKLYSNDEYAIYEIAD